MYAINILFFSFLWFIYSLFLGKPILGSFAIETDKILKNKGHKRTSDCGFGIKLELFPLAINQAANKQAFFFGLFDRYSLHCGSGTLAASLDDTLAIMKVGGDAKNCSYSPNDTGIIPSDLSAAECEAFLKCVWGVFGKYTKQSPKNLFTVLIISLV